MKHGFFNLVVFKLSIVTHQLPAASDKTRSQLSFLPFNNSRVALGEFINFSEIQWLHVQNAKRCLCQRVHRLRRTSTGKAHAPCWRPRYGVCSTTYLKGRPLVEDVSFLNRAQNLAWMLSQLLLPEILHMWKIIIPIYLTTFQVIIYFVCMWGYSICMWYTLVSVQVYMLLHSLVGLQIQSSSSC